MERKTTEKREGGRRGGRIKGFRGCLERQRGKKGRTQVGEERERKGGKKKLEKGQLSEMSVSIMFIGSCSWYQVNFQTEVLAIGCSAL